MLTAETKKHIDGARQVLVGKVPDPKAQIDQITNALIYKFMDDMDVKSHDAGGRASFFTGELEPYAWRKLMDPRKGAQERLNMYTEALEKFSTAATLPQLFRDIFRQAFLPYRDPETLNLFLKEVEFFDYNHSEELGNAFEYLLSIMGSQGDAGQFRTPRHIIDFIVDVIGPKYTDSILDPACGTAGFLISAYKHIVDKHDGVGENAQKNNEISLSHQQRQKLMENLEGYDISSDMVKLARVNMYLHNNNRPKIYEYDSLTSEERWDDNFDVIMANPPFMSPKGGIRPHNKFGVESSRAEVLFVDYIMTHLKQNGRAGIIVPEGVIFQSGKAYKQLRKNLIEDGLMAVISLPSGVFNPYAGVKTSILIFDNNRSKKSDQLIFAKVTHDGFDLGAQRRPTPDKNDLPVIATVLKKYRLGKLSTQAQLDDYLESEAALREIGRFNEVLDIKLVDRTKIAETGDYNLSASRYLGRTVSQNKRISKIKLGDVSELMTGGTPKSTNPDYYGGDIKWLVSGDIHRGEIFDCKGRITELALKESNARLLPINSVLIALNGQGKTRGTVALLRTEAACNQSLVSINPDNTRLLPEFLYYVLKSMYQQIRDITGDNQRSGLNMPIIRGIEIPLPQIEVQKEIVAELESYQKVINGAQQVIENYKPIIKFDASWQVKSLKEIAELIQRGKSPKYGESDIHVIKSGQARGYYEFEMSTRHTVTPDFGVDHRRLQPGDLLINSTGVGTAGRITLFDELHGKWLVDSHITILRLNKDASPDYVLYALAGKYGFKGLEKLATGSGGQIELGLGTIKNLTISLPPLEEQKRIAEQFHSERQIINANKKMIKIYEQKIKDKIAEVWTE